MTKDTPLPKQNDDKINEKNDEIKRLKKELAAAKKENDFLEQLGTTRTPILVENQENN